MSGRESLSALAHGRMPEGNGLLGNTRLEWRGVETLGDEALLSLFARQPFEPGEGAVVIESDRGIVWAGRDNALVADLYDGRVGRLWRLGPGEPGEIEPAVDVAFDPDMNQARGAVFCRAEDHPGLTAATLDVLCGQATSMLDGLRAGGALRARAFVVRAFRDEHAAVALLAIYTLSDEHPRQSRFAYGVVTTGTESPVAIIDEPLPRDWTPRL